MTYGDELGRAQGVTSAIDNQAPALRAGLFSIAFGCSPTTTSQKGLPGGRRRGLVELRRGAPPHTPFSVLEYDSETRRAKARWTVHENAASRRLDHALDGWIEVGRPLNCQVVKPPH